MLSSCPYYHVFFFCLLLIFIIYFNSLQDDVIRGHGHFEYLHKMNDVVSSSLVTVFEILNYSVLNYGFILFIKIRA